MAKKTKDAAASAKKEVKAKAPADPVKTKNLVRLLNILALLLAIAAFLLQLFAVLSHHWKWQTTALRPIISPTYHYSQPYVHEDSRLDQHYGLYSRDVKVYANNDEELDVRASTRFPRVDNDDEGVYHQCLSQTSTLRGAVLTCSDRVVSPASCHCRRYTYWNFVIVFEIIALVLLGVVVLLTALLTTQFQGILKLAAAGLALIAFILLLVGLILILSYLKRETRSFADAYPHIYQRLASKLGVDTSKHSAYQGSALRRAVGRRTAVRRTVLRRDVLHNPPERYRAYALAPGQHSYNETHYREYSDYVHAWLYKPYADLPPSYANVPSQNVIPPPSYVSYENVQAPTDNYAPRSQQSQESYAPQQNITAAPLYNPYGPALGYDTVFDNTRAGIGWSTILSIIAMVLALLLPLLLIFSWLTGKKLGPDTKTVTKTVTTEYVAVPQHDVTIPPVVARPIPVDYDYNRPVGDAIVTARNVRQGPYDIPVAQSVPLQREIVIDSTTPRPYGVNYDPHHPIGEAIVASHIRPGPYEVPVNQPERVIVRDVIIRDESPVKQTTVHT
jgi:hypothetical protein